MNDNHKAPKDVFNLRRFEHAQEEAYEAALSELKSEKKRSHWMWFIFPQFEGLGHSSMSKLYSVKSIEEAKAYISHPVLGTRLIECAETVIAIEGRSAFNVFGSPDDLKLKSSMTLFDYVAVSQNVYAHVLDKFYDGERCNKTLHLLKLI